MAKYKNEFRSGAWDPIMIISQMTALQAITYVSLSLLITVVQILLGVESSLDHVLHFHNLRSDTVFGWTLAMVWTLQAGIGVLLLGYIVERVRLCIDFTLTFMFMHLIMVTIYSHQLPSYFFWWFTMVVYTVVMIIGGEWFCMRREMRPIQFGRQSDEVDDDLVGAPTLPISRLEPGLPSSELSLNDPAEAVSLGLARVRGASTPRGSAELKRSVSLSGNQRPRSSLGTGDGRKGGRDRGYELNDMRREVTWDHRDNRPRSGTGKRSQVELVDRSITGSPGLTTRKEPSGGDKRLLFELDLAEDDF
ncbi:hypothetical protein IWQ62_001564 [Dispira parvispora]|uniref:Integral membrane protein S linking to the trans Golgi network-domain-containing protein n=1 Tax=Dispira parvispora TaxID=1520584 RepID=A0A9W8AUR0_9FUNG|nr:hypothetical protein IWQ62_001564 [Dispira parvispora]